MEENNPWSGIHYPRNDNPTADRPEEKAALLPEKSEPAVPEQPVPEERSDEGARLDSGALEALKDAIERQNGILDALFNRVQALSEQVQALTQQTEAAREERTEVRRVTAETRAALAQYIRTNALPHDVIKLLQVENEAMIRKLDIRPQTDILRSVRDLYLEMRRNRAYYEKSGDAAAIKLLDMLMITLQEDILEEHGVEILRSGEGTPFKALNMTNGGSVPTACRDQHMRVARSLEVGFRFEKEVLLKERVALYAYDPALETADEPEQAPDGQPASDGGTAGNCEEGKLLDEGEKEPMKSEQDVVN